MSNNQSLAKDTARRILNNFKAQRVDRDQYPEILSLTLAELADQGIHPSPVAAVESTPDTVDPAPLPEGAHSYREVPQPDGTVHKIYGETEGNKVPDDPADIGKPAGEVQTITSADIGKPAGEVQTITSADVQPEQFWY